MSQQSLDLRKSAHIVRRRKFLVGAIAAAGLVAGVGYATIHSPLTTSDALIVLPQGSPSVATQVVIINSDVVLVNALNKIHPAMTIETLQNAVEAKSLTPNVISVAAQAKSSTQAAAIANAVANSYIGYVGSATSPFGHVGARMLESATSTSTGGGAVKRYATDGIAGIILGVLVGAVLSLVLDRNDKRLRQRDDIANSIGVPVLASVPVGHPADAAGWTKLMTDYRPGITYAWRLRKALEQLGAFGAAGRPISVTVLSISADPGALALGPQLAVFAASQGVSTILVIGPQQETNTSAALATACAVPAVQWANRPANFLATVSEEIRPDSRYGAALTVVVTVVDSRDPQMHQTMRTDATVLGVSAGRSSAEQLARVAMAAASDHRGITGILVADPDSTDRTTGRIPHFVRSAQRRLPTRAEIPTESRR
jgi:capsular polysaccharide biosynthesis protein